MAKGKVTVKSLRAGQTVYRVCGFGPAAHIQKMTITSRPYVYKKKGSCLNGTLWVNYRRPHSEGYSRISGKNYYEDNFSLSDSGIHLPHMNSTNRTFYSYKAAVRWCEYVNTLPKKERVFDDFDIFGIWVGPVVDDVWMLDDDR
ncbi:hypothetical protein ASwh1_396 [Aeromonas phage Aswh_1]|nr:hypothetical protein ASwh1_396 [Aeromonas phage Aswh_1]